MLPIPKPYRVTARHDKKNREYFVQFKKFEEHAIKHVSDEHEQWCDFISDWTAGVRVPVNHIYQYFDLTREAVCRCFDLPRYAFGDGYDANDPDGEDRAPDALKDKKSVTREWTYVGHVFYFGCYETAILVAAKVIDSEVYIRTAYRLGVKGDHLGLRIWKLKWRMIHMVRTQHEEHLFVPFKWYDEKSWQFPNTPHE